MSIRSTALPLRKLLNVDTLACALMGLVLVFAAGPLAALMAIPRGLLFYAGIALLAVAVFIAAVATRRSIPGPAVVVIVAGNTLWVVASLVLMIGDWIAPNALGYAFIGVQAVVVAALAMLEHIALRRTAAARA